MSIGCCLRDSLGEQRIAEGSARQNPLPACTLRLCTLRSFTRVLTPNPIRENAFHSHANIQQPYKLNLELMSRAPPPSWSTNATTWILTYNGRGRDKDAFMRKLVDVCKRIGAECAPDVNSQAIITLSEPRNKLALKPFFKRNMS